MEIIITIGLVLAAIAGYYYYHEDSKKRLKIGLMNEIRLFSPDEYVISADNKHLLAIDKRRRKLAYVSNDGDYSVFGKTELISAEILVNDVLQTKKSLIETWGKYYVMKNLFGEGHATIAALNSSEKTNKLITRVSLKISTRSLKAPFVEFLFYRNTAGTKKINFGLVYQWEGYVKAITH